MPYEIDPEYGCWLWTGRTIRGIPFISRNGESTTARRYYYERDGLEVPEGKVLSAICGRANCIRPSHADPVDGRELHYLTGQTKVTPFVFRQAQSLMARGASRREAARRLGVDEKALRKVEKRREVEGIVEA